jgi:branched-chain amino acid transport system substrate-binding protein
MTKTRKLSRRAVTSMLALGPAILAAPRVFAAQAPKDPPLFKIGVLLGLTDKANWNALVMQRGILMAVEELNAAGGIDGIKVEAVIEDHQGVPRVGVDALQRLRSRHDIQAVLLSYSTIGLATAPICEENKIFMLDGGSVTDALVGPFKYLFHNRSVASVMARAALTIPKKLGFKKMAQMVASTDDGQSLMRAAEADWKAYGGQIVATEQALSAASNVDTQVSKLKAASDAEFLAIWQFSPGPGLVMKRAREFGMKQPIIGIEYTAEIGKVAGPHVEGYMFAMDYFNPDSGDDWPKRFTESYRKRNNGENPEVYAANYYEGIYVVAEAIKRARTEGGNYFTGERLAEALRKSPVVPSVYGGNMTFQPDGTGLKRVGVFKVADGKAVFQNYAEIK